jgi:hypothetical protein
MSVLVDAHVHVHDCFDLDEFLTAAAGNFHSQSQSMGLAECRYVLCLTETFESDKYRALLGLASGDSVDAGATGSGWRFSAGADGRSVVAAHPQYAELEIVTGRQIVTAERLEVLALGALAEWEDGMPARAVIESVLEAGAIAVLPWGFGKWLGRRRRVIESLIDEFAASNVYLGDNGGRSAILPTPPEFARAEALGMRILPGSDPLPFESEYDQAGSYGFRVDNFPFRDNAWPDLCAMLQRGEGELTPFGSLESPLRFARNQLAMQYKTRIAARQRAA